MQEVELDPVDLQFGEQVSSGQHGGTVLAWQSENHMHTDAQAALFGAEVGVNKGCTVMTTPQKSQGLIVAALQTEFQPEVAALVIVGKQVENLLGEAVRPGTDRQADHIRDGQGLVVEPAQSCNRCQGIGKRLEVGDEPGCLVLAGHDLLARFKLSRYGQSSVDPHRPGASGVAEQAACPLAASTTIGAAEACIDGNLVNAAPKKLFKLLRKQLVTFNGHDRTMPSSCCPDKRSIAVVESVRRPSQTVAVSGGLAIMKLLAD